MLSENRLGYAARRDLKKWAAGDMTIDRHGNQLIIRKGWVFDRHGNKLRKV